MSDLPPSHTADDEQLSKTTSSAVPHSAEGFGMVPNDAESFGNVPHSSERHENHTLTVRAVARLFENAGVARTERSIVNWCQPNRQGIARLDAYYEVNERKWFITPQSADRAIAEEKMKAAQHDSESPPNGGEAGRGVPKDSELTEPDAPDHLVEASGRVGDLKKQVMDLRILNGGKDLLIERLSQERDGFIHKLIEGSRRIGQLETKLSQLAAPRDRSSGFESEVVDDPDHREAEVEATVGRIA